MNLVELADELGLTTAATVDHCRAVGIEDAGRETELSAEQVTAVRRSATTTPPQPTAAPLPPGSAPPPPGAPGVTAPFGAPAPPPPPPPAPTGAPGPPGAFDPTTGVNATPGYGAPSYGQPAGYGPPPYGQPVGYGPPPYGYPPGGVPPAPPRFRLVPESPVKAAIYVTLLVIIVLAVPILAIVMLGTSTDDTFDEVGGLDPDDPSAGNGPITDQLHVGDCFQMPDSAYVMQIDTTPCSTPHDVEVYATVEHPADLDAPPPTAEDLLSQAFEMCSEPYEDFLGAPYGETIYDIYVIYPPGPAWTVFDERTIVCGIYDPLDDTTGTLEGAAA